jgi:hypothetical protein
VPARRGLAAHPRLLGAPGGAYGGELTLGTGGHGSLAGLVDTTWQFYFPRLPAMGQRLGPPYGYRQLYIEGLFGRFASLEVGYPGAVYDLIQTIVAIGIAALVATVMVRWTAVKARWREIVMALAIAVSMIGLLHLASYRSLTGTTDPLITGRYLLPVAGVFALGVAFVISSLRQRTSAVLGAVVLSGLLALNLAGLMLTFTRFYA